jgi:hypothetical protein
MKNEERITDAFLVLAIIGNIGGVVDGVQALQNVKRVSDIILPVIPGSQEVVPVTTTNIIVSLVVNVVMMFILTWLLFRRSRNKQDLSYSLTSLFMFLTAFMYILMSMLLVTVEVRVQKSRNMTYVIVTLLSIMMSFLSVYGIMVRHA